MSTDGSKASDFSVFGPVGRSLLSCAVQLDCTDITALTENFAGVTYNYKGVGTGRSIHSVSEENPADNTFTLQGTDEELGKNLVKLGRLGCQSWLQRRHCTGRGEHYRLVRYTDRSPQGRLSAKGVNATDDPQISNINGTFLDVIEFSSPSDSAPKSLLTTSGKYVVAPNGVVDGANTVFTLDPFASQAFPLSITIDGVLQVETTDYTLTSSIVSTTTSLCGTSSVSQWSAITFVTAPACDEVIEVTYYTDEYLTHNLTPAQVWFCDNPSCGSGGSCATGVASDGCMNVHAIYADGDAGNDACGDSLGRNGVLATYTLEEGTLSFSDAEVIAGIYDPIDAVCMRDGTIVIATASAIYEGTTSSLTESTINLPAGSSIVALAYSRDADEAYALFGNTGVMKRGTDATWGVKLPDGNIAVGNQVAISANGCVVVTAGDSGSGQVSQNSGSTWSGIVLGDTTVDLVDVKFGLSSNLSQSQGIVYALGVSATQTILYASEDHGSSFESRKSWSDVPDVAASLKVPLDDWMIYVKIDETVYRSTVKGCDRNGLWDEITNCTAPKDSIMDACYYDPTQVVQIGPQDDAAAGDDFVSQGALTTDAVHRVLLNDTPGCDIDGSLCTLDITSINITAAPALGTATAQVDGTVLFDATGGTAAAAGQSTTYEYSVTDSCGTTVQATVTVNFT